MPLFAKGRVIMVALACLLMRWSRSRYPNVPDPGMSDFQLSPGEIVRLQSIPKRKRVGVRRDPPNVVLPRAITGAW